MTRSGVQHLRGLTTTQRFGCSRPGRWWPPVFCRLAYQVMPATEARLAGSSRLRRSQLKTERAAPIHGGRSLFLCQLRTSPSRLTHFQASSPPITGIMCGSTQPILASETRPPPPPRSANQACARSLPGFRGCPGAPTPGFNSSQGPPSRRLRPSRPFPSPALCAGHLQAP